MCIHAAERERDIAFVCVCATVLPLMVSLKKANTHGTASKRHLPTSLKKLVIRRTTQQDKGKETLGFEVSIDGFVSKQKWWCFHRAKIDHYIQGILIYGKLHGLVY